MSKGGDQPTGSTTTTTVNSPWSGQQPYLTQGFQAAQNLFNQGGPSYYQGQSYAGPTDLQLTGIENEANLGLNGTPVQNSAFGTFGNIANNNWLTANPGNPTYTNAALGGLNVTTGNLFQPIASGQQTNTMGVPRLTAVSSGTASNPLAGSPSDATLSQAASGNLANTQGQDVLSGIAHGAQASVPGMSTLADIASGANLTAENPYFKQMADTVRANILPQIQGQFNAGNRLDSGLASRAVGEGLGDSIGALAYNNYQQGLQQQQSAAQQLASLGQNATSQQASAAGQLGQLGQANLGQQLGAANSLGSFGQQNIQNQLGAAGQLSNIGQNNIGNQLAASTALTNLGFGNIANQLAGGQGLSQNFANAAQNQLGALGLAPSLNNMSYQQAAALQDAGQTTQGLNQAAINDAMARWNYGQQQPYANLQNYMQNIMGNYGGTSATTQPYFQNGTANALSTGLGAFTLGNALTGGQLSSGLGNLFGNLFGTNTTSLPASVLNDLGFV